MDLHADDNGAPGDHLASMTMPGDFAPGESTKADLITVAPRHTNLNSDTRYWIVFSNEQDQPPLRQRNQSQSGRPHFAPRVAD